MALLPNMVLNFCLRSQKCVIIVQHEARGSKEGWEEVYENVRKRPAAGLETPLSYPLINAVVGILKLLHRLGGTWAVPA